MSEYATEALFVGTFWDTIEKNTDEGRSIAWQAMALVTPEMLEDTNLRDLYDNLRVRFSEGETTELPIVLRDLPAYTMESLCDVMDAAVSRFTLADYAKVIKQDSQAREFAGLCTKALDHLAGDKVKEGGKQVAERLALRLMSIYTGHPDSAQGFQSREQSVAEGRNRALAEVSGVTLPWPKLEAACGPLVPGEIVGITAYSGEGKSTVASNLFNGFIDAGIPCIPIPTEMGGQWLDRAVAARAGVEQWRAEKRKWKFHEDQREKFLAEYDAIKSLNWLMVNRMDISPAEIATAVRVLRKRWEGPVVFMVDHMHRLNYGGDEADKKAGEATRMFKNLAGELGIIGILLYQPRKPPMGATHHGPVAGHQIRGHSSIWNELDIHLSPFRAWVKTNADYGQTPSGTLCCDYEPGSNKPKFTKPDDEYGKLDDEHVYIKVDKRRVGGEGPTVFLNYEQTSGKIYELDTTPRMTRDVA